MGGIVNHEHDEEIVINSKFLSFQISIPMIFVLSVIIVVLLARFSCRGVRKLSTSRTRDTLEFILSPSIIFSSCVSCHLRVLRDKNGRGEQASASGY